MGLDNGIELKVPETKEYPEFAPKGEVCYWRKCWGIREAILKVLDPDGKIEAKIQCGAYDIEIEDIPSIIKALKPFFSKEHWEENAGSIWEFEEMFEALIKQVINLEKLKEYLEENKDASAYFYDSY